MSAAKKSAGHRRPSADTDNPENLTDLGNARRFVRLFGKQLRYSPERKKWYVWNDLRWEIDRKGRVQQFAKQIPRAIYKEAAKIKQDFERGQVVEHGRRTEGKAVLQAMVSLAETEPGIPVLACELDNDPMLLNVLNGTLDLRTGGLRKHSPADLITKLVPVNFIAEAQCPRWNAFLERIMPSADLRRFFQRVIGYSLTGDVSERALFFLYGEGGDNGKTTVLEVLAAILGDYAQNIETSSLLIKKTDAVRNDIARLDGARFVSGSEIEDGRRLAESLVKQLTGGDRITARFLHQEFFDFTPQFKFLIAGNHKPTIHGSDDAIWRRIRLIPFDVTIPPKEQDKSLRLKLSEEAPGFLAWAVRGCLEWQERRQQLNDGLGAPREVAAATAEYREEMDKIGAFLAECTRKDPIGDVGSAELHRAFVAFCAAAGEPSMSNKEFTQRLTRRGLPKKPSRTGARWRGISLCDG